MRNHKINPMILLIALLIFVILIVAFDTKKVLLISGDSMDPTIKSGTIALIKKTPIEDIETDDIVCFLENEQFIVHRVSGIYTDNNNNIELRTKGDANRLSDNTVVNRDNYIGELGISIWITDIFLEILPKLLGALLIVLGAITTYIRSKVGSQS